MATDAEEIPPEWRPTPLPVAALLLVGMVALVAWSASRAHTVDEHFGVLALAGCGAQTLLWAARWVTRRRPVLLIVYPGRRWLRRVIIGVIAATPLAYLLLGLPPEDGAITALPLVWLSGEALLAAGVPHVATPASAAGSPS